MQSWLMGIPQLQVSKSHVATFLRWVWNILDGRWRILGSFKENRLIWAILTHDFIRVSRQSCFQTVNSKLEGAGSSDVADNCQSRIFSLHCWVHKRLWSVLSVVFISFSLSEKENQWFLPPRALKSYWRKTLTWCHPNPNWDSKICMDILVRLNA